MSLSSRVVNIVILVRNPRFGKEKAAFGVYFTLSEASDRNNHLVNVITGRMDFEKVYEKALEDKTLPGYALLAGDKNGQYTSLRMPRIGLNSMQARYCTLEQRACSRSDPTHRGHSNWIRYVPSLR